MKRTSSGSSNRTGGGIVIDIGTGDGTFVYQSARERIDTFFIGIDASPRALEKISEKIHRKPEKGGLANVLFLQAAAEDLPSELDAIADEVHVHFPWGSLLRGVASGERLLLQNLRRICAPGALVEIVIGIDADRDRGEIERLGLPLLSKSYIDSGLAPRYAAAGLEIVESGELAPCDWAVLRTSWAKRLRNGAGRSVYTIIARPH